MCLQVANGKETTEECHVCCTDDFCMQAEGVIFTPQPESGSVEVTVSVGLLVLMAIVKTFF
jgi:hypothetical protein